MKMARLSFSNFFANTIRKILVILLLTMRLAISIVELIEKKFVVTFLKSGFL